MRRLKTMFIAIASVLAACCAAAALNKELRDRFISDLKWFLAVMGKEECASIFSDKTQRRPPHEFSGKKKIRNAGQLKIGDEVALYFKDGSVITGELAGRTKDEYIIKWKGQDTVVCAGQVDRIGSPQEALEEKKNLLSDEEIAQCWPYDNDIVVRLTNRIVLDGRITRVGGDGITIEQNVEGGGRIEQDVPHPQIDYLIFKPVNNERSQNIENALKKLFPKMEFYKDGNFTLATDSDVVSAGEYIATLRGAYTDIYFKFFDLFKDRRPQIQNFLVMFDDYVDFVEYAIADGVPGWAVAGYFNPSDEALYLFNALGRRFSGILFEALVGESGRRIDDMADQVGNAVDERYRIFIEGQAKTVKDKYWKAYTYYKGIFRNSTLSTLRHEFAHELFYNWGLQNITLSRVEKDKDGMTRKKKEFLETGDYRKKAELVKALMAMRAGEEALETQAANSWLAEGVAAYCETKPPGSRNDRWLFLYQQMTRKGSIYPLESLTVYKMGSFPGVCMQGMLYSYAQSWALVAFLMDRYPGEFMKYQRKMAEVAAKGSEDIAWLADAMGKDIRSLEAEFTEYMKKFSAVEDPRVDEFMKLYSIFNE